MNAPYAAFFDLDGTLAANNEPPFPTDVAAMRAFRSRGNFLFLCTGRSYGYLYQAIVDIGFDGIIAGAGAQVLLGDTLLFRAGIDPEKLTRIQRAFENSSSTLIMETESTMVQLASPAANKVIRSYDRIYTADEWRSAYSAEHTSKLTVYGDIPADILPFVREHCDIVQHPEYAEILPKGCSKATGIAHILNAIGVPRERSIGFGDSMNDYDMLQYVGLGVAMGNAADTVKAIAHRVTAPFDKGGVAQVLNEFI